MPATAGIGLLDAQAGDRPGDHQLLDLLGALEDVEDLRVAMPALHRVLTGVSVATEDLDRTLCDPAIALAQIDADILRARRIDQKSGEGEKTDKK